MTKQLLAQQLWLLHQTPTNVTSNLPSVRDRRSRVEEFKLVEVKVVLEVVITLEARARRREQKLERGDVDNVD